MALDAQENFYLGGVTISSNFPVTAGAPQPSSPAPAGDEDIFIAKFATTPDGRWRSPGPWRSMPRRITVDETAGTAVINVTRSGGANGAVSVTCTAAVAGGDTATAGVDFTATTVTLNWADGDAANKTCAIPIANDTRGRERRDVHGDAGQSHGRRGTRCALESATVTITDDDVAPVAAARHRAVQSRELQRQ